MSDRVQGAWIGHTRVCPRGLPIRTVTCCRCTTGEHVRRMIRSTWSSPAGVLVAHPPDHRPVATSRATYLDRDLTGKEVRATIRTPDQRSWNEMLAQLMCRQALAAVFGVNRSR
jgi:hypothetical protein